MKTFVIHSFAELHALLEELQDRGGLLYRGVSDIDEHKLIPSVGRYLNAYIRRGLTREDLLEEEKRALRVFRTECTSFLREPPRTTWELLAVAQHHGLPTRLLDWSLNPLTALYFAVAPDTSCDAALYVVDLDHFVDNERELNYDPFTIDQIRAYMPAHVSPRIRAQSGLFTVQPDPTVEFDHPSLVCIRVPAATRLSLRRALTLYGFTPRGLFPDLDGLAQWIKGLKFRL